MLMGEAMEKIRIGKIQNTIGLKGELKVQPETADINRFKWLKEFYIDNEKYMCEYGKIRNDKVCLKIVGFDRIEDVEKFKNKPIFVDRKDAIPLKKDEYLAVDLMECEVYYEDKFMGRVTEVANYGASDIIFVKNKGVEHSFVIVEGLFKQVDTIAKKIFVTSKIEDVFCE